MKLYIITTGDEFWHIIYLFSLILHLFVFFYFKILSKLH